MRLLRVLGSLAAVSLAFIMVPGSASAGDSWNEYSIVGLPAFISVPTPFTVGVDGPDEVCSMTYRHDEIEVTRTAPPWTFVAQPAEGWAGLVHISGCGEAGRSATVPVETQVPFDVAPSVIALERAMYRVGNRDGVTLQVTNYMDVPATARVSGAGGRVVAEAVISSSKDPDRNFSGTTDVRIPLKGLESTTQLTISITSDNGIAMTRRIVVARGWAPFEGGRTFAAPCSTVSWSFSAKGQPKAGSTMKKDVINALDRLSRLTGLKFIEVAPSARAPQPSQWESLLDSSSPRIIAYQWDNLGLHGPSGWGSTSGSVKFNNKDYWTTNVYAGFSLIRGYLPGRGWLVVHETMHVLGFDHVNDKAQLMNPLAYSAKFGEGDLAGLRTLYPKSGCPAS